MTETPTPRTHAFREGMSKERGLTTSYFIALRHAYELETDLQHLARVAEEALKGFLVATWDGDPRRQADCPLCIKAEEVLTEINRIKNQTT